jgi:hypothetical protein
MNAESRGFDLLFILIGDYPPSSAASLFVKGLYFER